MGNEISNFILPLSFIYEEFFLLFVEKNRKFWFIWMIFIETLCSFDYWILKFSDGGVRTHFKNMFVYLEGNNEDLKYQLNKGFKSLRLVTLSIFNSLIVFVIQDARFTVALHSHSNATFSLVLLSKNQKRYSEHLKGEHIESKLHCTTQHLWITPFKLISKIHTTEVAYNNIESPVRSLILINSNRTVSYTLFVWSFSFYVSNEIYYFMCLCCIVIFSINNEKWNELLILVIIADNRWLYHFREV